MLTAETKRHIDAARQVLVGKVPDPKQQIDQITNALIYKFMDDMDEKAKAAGGRASFFIGDLEPYAWRKLMDPRKGAQERLNTYTEALEKFSTSGQLPQLFRDIFRQAFLPYRSPETLDLFLKEIEYFDYNHSEELGNAFEYLLSIMGAQGDAGQFRTPRHIIEFIVDIIDPDIDDTILDPACGTAGFLISAYKHIVEKHDGKDEEGKPNKEKKLTHAQHTKMLENMVGYDISSDMVKLARVNMYLHGNRSPKIYEYDTLSSEERWNDNFDVIMANPPFMSPKGGIRPHNKFSVQSSRAEVLFVDYIMSHLKQNGRAGIIVPEGVIFQSGTAYKQLRKMLVEDGLLAVVSLPAGVFNPYAGVKTSILIFDNNRAKRSKDILFAKVNHDGFDLGAQRRPIKHNDLPVVAHVLRQFRNGELSTQPEIDDYLENEAAVREPGSFSEVIDIKLVSRDKIAGTGDYNLTASRYIVAEANQNQKWPMVGLGLVAEFINGYGFKKEDWKLDGKPIIRIQNLTGTSSVINYTDKEDWPKKYEVKNGDLLISWSASIGFYIWQGPNAYLNQHIFNVKVDDRKILKLYLFYLKDQIIDEIKKFVHGNTMTHVTRKDFQRIMIPLPPIEVQKKIVAQLDSYQKIIDGARQVSENLDFEVKPSTDWPVKALSELADINSESTTPSRFGDTFHYLDISSVGNNLGGIRELKVLKTKAAPSRARRKVHEGDTVVSTVRPNLKAFAYVDNLPDDTIASTGFGVLTPKSGTDPKYLYFVTASGFVVEQMVARMGKGAYPSINQNDLASLRIPLPDLITQKQIASDLESRERARKTNEELIEIYEKKIKDKIAEVWGE